MTKDSLPTLYYIHDPMCSWCWGFRPVWHEVQKALAGTVNIQYVLGGLAADTREPMPEDMQRSIQRTWQRIQQAIPGTEFNYDFWTECQPRRSTYPACRAVIACRMQQPELEQKMLLAIQQAYYLQARNPSDDDVLIRLAESLSLDTEQFANDLNSSECKALFDYELAKTRAMYINSFPSLVLIDGDKELPVYIDYTNKNYILQQIKNK